MGYKNDVEDKTITSKCHKASGYMMKYMDGELTKSEAQWLKEHVASCHECHEDFLLYDMMMDEFSDVEIFDAPDNFEQLVMLKINELCTDTSSEKAAKAASSLDNIILAVWGVFSIVFGAGFLLFLNREQIMTAMETNESFALYLQIVRPISNVVTEFTTNLQIVFNSALTTMSSFVSDYRFAILGIFGLLVVAQYVLRVRKSNIDIAFADEKVEKN